MRMLLRIGDLISRRVLDTTVLFENLQGHYGMGLGCVAKSLTCRGPK